MASQDYERQVAKVDEINAKLEEMTMKQAKVDAKIAANNLKYQTSIDKVATLKGKIDEVTFKEAERSSKEMEKNTRQAEASTKRMSRAAKTHTANIKSSNKALEGMGKGLSNAISKIGKMALAVLSIRSAYMLVRQASSTLSQYNEQYATDLEYIRYVIAQGLAPILEKVVSLAQTLLAYVNYIVQAIFGVNLFANATAEAFKRAKDNLGGAAKSSKEIKNNLASFDEINVLAQDSGAGGGGALTPSLDIGGLSDVEIPEWLQKINEIKKDFVSLGETIKNNVTPYVEELKKGIQEGVGKASLEEINKDISSIGQHVKDIFTDPEVQQSARKAATKISNALGKITGSAARIGTNYATLVVGSTESYLDENKERVQDHMVTMFDLTGRGAEIAGNTAVALADISDVFSSQEAQDIGGDIIAIFANPFMSIQELAAKFGVDILDTITKPFIDNKDKIKTTIEEMFEPIKRVTETVKNAVTWIGDKINEVYDQHIHPFFESIRDGWSNTFGKLLDVYNEHVKPVIDKLSERFTDLWENHMQPYFEKFQDFIGKLINLFKVLWENWIKPIVDWIVENVLPVLMPILETLGNVIATVFGAIFDYLGGLFDALGGLLDFLAGVFSGDWELAWEGIKEFFGGIWDGMVGILKGAVNLIIDIINGLIASVEKALNLIREKINTLLSIVPDDVLESVGVKLLPHFDLGRIPHLAQGGIVARPTQAVIGEAGREAVMPLDNNTEWMDILADKIGGGNITIKFTGSTAQLVRLLKPELEKEDKRTGKRLIIGGAY